LGKRVVDSEWSRAPAELGAVGLRRAKELPEGPLNSRATGKFR